MSPSPLIPVEEAAARVVVGLEPLPAEVVALPRALGRVLADAVVARRTQPPAALSAMDGWAIRAADAATVPSRLRIIGAAPAGHRFAGQVGPGEAVRIFTGGMLPDGADAVVIQEDAQTFGEHVEIREAARPGRHIRQAGIDFRTGEAGLPAGRLLSARDIGLLAAMNVPWVPDRKSVV